MYHPSNLGKVMWCLSHEYYILYSGITLIDRKWFTTHRWERNGGLPLRDCIQQVSGGTYRLGVLGMMFYREFSIFEGVEV